MSVFRAVIEVGVHMRSLAQGFKRHSRTGLHGSPMKLLVQAFETRHPDTVFAR